MRHRLSRPPRGAAAAAAAVALVCAGCAAEPDPDVYTIMNSATDEPYHSWDDEVMAECGAQAGVEVRQQSVPADQLVPKALRMASSHSLPDVLVLDGSDMPQFADPGGLVPLAELGMPPDELSDGARSFGSYDGTYYGAARSVNSLGLFYNEDMLADAGVEPPQTWDELRETAAELTEGDRYGLAISALSTEDGVYQFLPWLWSNGGDERRLDEPEAVEALEFVSSLIDDGSASRSAVNWTQADVNDQFVAGNTAMMINGPWQKPVLDEHPDVDWGVVEVPVPEEGADPVAPIGGTTFTVPANSRNPEREQVAGELVTCLTASDAQLEWSTKANNVPVAPQAAEEYREQVPELAAFADQVETARSRTEHVGTDYSVYSQAIGTAVQAALTGEATPEQALTRAQSQVEQELRSRP
ncbi:sugar ABC transporter substrate-binding protein [Streptomonospora salina]|uniref:Multiple sugar transport system substrate-binding protein n=1 Tax=Streptomonospora salina TaxID=104205 RepID=A0A841DYT8_9ACTN|nr:sugar ABC transporter substrate-binding protein [Streptomonospora salina]MBB5996627.1 multiple sugar transport system substrate-binding protein [Streptomonospora salina]